MGKITVQGDKNGFQLISLLTDTVAGEGPEFLILPSEQEAGSMDCQMVCEWSFETASRAERVLSGAVPSITKRQLLCGDAWCCNCVAQEGRSASLTLNSTNVADCSHKVMKTLAIQPLTTCTLYCANWLESLHYILLWAVL